MAISLPPLPYADDALAPVISKETIEFHYGKHHKTYVDKLNDMIPGTPHADAKLEDIVRNSAGKADQKGVFNNSGQIWNHTCFWESMKAGGGGKPSGDIAKRIDNDFGSYDNFHKAFLDTAVGQFGSGWTWLIEDGGKLTVVGTANAETPMAQGKKVLLTCDVWEHAYYIDYRNRRPDFVKAFLDKLIDWDRANQRLKG